MHEVWVGNIMSPASPKGCMVDIKSSISNAGHIIHCLLECMLDGSGYGADGGPLLEICSSLVVERCQVCKAPVL